MRTQTDTKREWTANVCTWQMGPMQREMRTDEQLMLAFAQGEVSAFDELFLRYGDLRYGEKLRVFFARRSSSADGAPRKLLQPRYVATACAVLLALTFWAQLSASRIHVDEQTVRAKLKSPDPKYPEGARRKRIQGGRRSDPHCGG